MVVKTLKRNHSRKQMWGGGRVRTMKGGSNEKKAAKQAAKAEKAAKAKHHNFARLHLRDIGVNTSKFGNLSSIGAKYSAKNTVTSTNLQNMRSELFAKKQAEIDKSRFFLPGGRKRAVANRIDAALFSKETSNAIARMKQKEQMNDESSVAFKIQTHLNQQRSGTSHSDLKQNVNAIFKKKKAEISRLEEEQALRVKAEAALKYKANWDEVASNSQGYLYFPGRPPYTENPNPNPNPNANSSV